MVVWVLSPCGCRILPFWETCVEFTLIIEKKRVIILYELYLKEEEMFFIKKNGCSSTWKAILKTLECLKDGFKFKIGNGETNIWFRPWISKHPMIDKVHDIYLVDLNKRQRIIGCPSNG